MPTLIRNNAVVSDDWLIVQDGVEATGQARVIVPASYTTNHASTLFAHLREIGIWLEGDAELDDVVVALLDRVALIAIHFPAFNDGRGLSLAVLLRTRFGYTGELRAIGDVHTDTLHYLRRCGFDSYLLPDGRDPAIALTALDSLTDFYQGSVAQPLPAFRRGARGRIAA
jgi:uncharacterized protein (DUF934 family)